MTIKLPRITPEQAIRAIQKLDFTLARQSGSHKIFKNPKGKRITIPYHKGKILHPKVVKSILRDAEIPPEEFQNLL